MTNDRIPPDDVPAIAGHLHRLAAQVAEAEPAQAAGLLSGVLGEAGVLDAVRDLLDTAVDFVQERAQAAGHDPTLYAVWHTLRNAADPLHHEADALHAAPHLFGELPQGPGVSAPKPAAAHAWEQWVPPSAVRDLPAALDAITERLDAGTIPVSAAMLLAPVLDPDGGVLDRLAVLLASASRYAQQHGAAPEVWQDLARVGENLDGWSQALAGTTAEFAQLPTTAPGPARRPALPSRTPAPAPAPDPTPGSAVRRGR